MTGENFKKELELILGCITNEFSKRIIYWDYDGFEFDSLKAESVSELINYLENGWPDSKKKKYTKLLDLYNKLLIEYHKLNSKNGNKK